jgi:hypothetical protein
VKMPAFIQADALSGPLIFEVRVGLKWPPEIETTPENARVELLGSCLVESLEPPN